METNPNSLDGIINTLDYYDLWYKWFIKCSNVKEQVEGSSGLFVGMPSKKDKDGEYNDTIIVGKMVDGKFAPDKMLKEKLNKLAIDYYNQDQPVVETPTENDDIPF